MARDIEEFLKMAAKRRQEQKQKAAGQPAQPQRPGAAAPSPRSKPPVQKRPPAGQRPAPPPRVPPTGSRPLPSQQSPAPSPTVGDHVRQHINTRSIAAHAEHLGQEVSMADDKMDGRIHDVFDHSVATIGPGSLTTSETSAGSSTPDAKLAVELVAMLRSPASIRQAILLSEILKRPDFD